MEKLYHRTPAGEATEPVTKLYAPPVGSVEMVDKSFPGVVLWTEPQLPKRLVAPVPAWLDGAMTLEPNLPMRIAFAGQYWMFRPPNSRPPEKAYSRRGSPAALSFITTDHIPMLMEAHQTLEHAIDVRCCTAIQVEIVNADRFPGTVVLELVLSDTATGRSQSFGTAGVKSRPSRGQWASANLPQSETLSFRIPASVGLSQFDEIKVVFHRARLRVDRSARIAIEGFTLVPR